MIQTFIISHLYLKPTINLFVDLTLILTLAMYNTVKKGPWVVQTFVVAMQRKTKLQKVSSRIWPVSHKIFVLQKICCINVLKGVNYMYILVDKIKNHNHLYYISDEQISAGWLIEQAYKLPVWLITALKTDLSNVFVFVCVCVCACVCVHVCVCACMCACVRVTK